MGRKYNHIKMTPTSRHILTASPAAIDYEDPRKAIRLADGTLITRLGFRTTPELKCSSQELASVIASAPPRTRFFCDTNWFIAHRDQVVWDVLLGRKIAIVPPILGELESWIKAPTYNVQARDLISRMLEHRTDTPFEVYQFGSADPVIVPFMEYYVNLLGIRGRLFSIVSGQLAKELGRAPTAQEREARVKKVFGERGYQRARKAEEGTAEKRTYADEALVLYAVATAILFGEEVAILSGDADVQDQFYKLCWLMHTHYRGMIVAERYSSDPGSFLTRPMPKHIESLAQGFIGEDDILIAPGPSLRGIPLLPPEFSPVPVYCWLVKGQGEYMSLTETVFGAEREMARLIRIKGETAGLNTNRLGGRNCHFSLHPVSTYSMAVVRDRRIQVRCAQIPFLDLNQALCTDEPVRYAVIGSEDIVLPGWDDDSLGGVLADIRQKNATRFIGPSRSMVDAPRLFSEQFAAPLEPAPRGRGWIRRLSFQDPTPVMDFLAGDLAKLVDRSALDNAIFFPDARFLMTPIASTLWEALLKKRILITPSVLAEIAPWLTSPTCNIEICEAIRQTIREGHRSVGLAQIGREYHSHAFPYYFNLLAYRKAVGIDIGAALETRLGRTPTGREMTSECRKWCGERGWSLAKKGWDERGKPNYFRDEELVVCAVTTALLTGAETVILTRDEDVSEQFFRLTSLLVSHYMAMIVANVYAVAPERFACRTFPIPPSHNLFCRGHLVSFSLSRRELIAIMPSTYTFVTVYCWFVGGEMQHLEFSPLALAAETEMRRLLRVKMRTGGRNTERLAGRTCHLGTLWAANNNDFRCIAAIARDRYARILEMDVPVLDVQHILCPPPVVGAASTRRWDYARQRPRLILPEGDA